MRGRAAAIGGAGPQAGKSGAASQTSIVHAQIRDDIIRGRLEPGLKLKIELLQERYGSGATPLREALSLLSASGLVEREDQRGFRVARISVDEFEEMLSTRCFLEERALRESIAHGGSDWEERVVLALYHLSRAPIAESAEDFEAADLWEARNGQFHAELISGCRSKWLLRFCAQLYDENKRYRYIARLVPRSRSGSLEEHNRIADAALARDADLAVTRLTEHYRRTGELMRERLRTQTET